MRALVHLGLDSPVREVAAACDIPESHLATPVHWLGRSGFIATAQRRNGGLARALAADEIDLVAVLRMAGRPGDLARYPWVDFDRPATAGHASLFALARGPWLAWLSIELLRCPPGELVRPLLVEIGHFRYRTDFVARRSPSPTAGRDLVPKVTTCPLCLPRSRAASCPPRARPAQSPACRSHAPRPPTPPVPRGRKTRHAPEVEKAPYR